ncbi:MAG: hypothetical protein DI536_23240 [Archangium gephyra]|uniref:Uncharacterized protein n=1 Tax=Archangium gephyra TaxID=48 RepID=A0A2W5T1C8_9BACT|nr:MAG: hypothetical protein DI536_23240 [Archangium gephyra]
MTGLVILANAALNGIVDGKVLLGWHGGDAFGPVLVGATLTMETTFTGTRVGSYDPPPFTPAPVVLPADAGFADAGTWPVARSCDVSAEAEALHGRA